MHWLAGRNGASGGIIVSGIPYLGGPCGRDTAFRRAAGRSARGIDGPTAMLLIMGGR